MTELDFTCPTVACKGTIQGPLQRREQATLKGEEGVGVAVAVTGKR